MKVLSVEKFQARGKLLREFLNDQLWRNLVIFVTTLAKISILYW